MPENTSDLNTSNLLDSVRHTDGIDNLKLKFREIVCKNTHEAINLLNNKNLNYSSLFSLRSVVYEFDLHRYLNFRNTCALKITERILAGKPSKTTNVNHVNRENMHSILKWIFDTGCSEDVSDNRHEEIIEVSALLLIKSYRDRTILRKVIDIIFERNRRGAYTYDLIWAAFESSAPDVLVAIAERLLSKNEKDVELAGRLLKFIPSDDRLESLQQSKQKTTWINENFNYLYYTREAMHQCCNPIPFDVSQEAKYICKLVSPDKGDFIEPLSKDEHKLLIHFSALDNTSKKMLADCSAKLKKTNSDNWSSWLNSPLSEQIIYAYKLGGVL